MVIPKWDLTTDDRVFMTSATSGQQQPADVFTLVSRLSTGLRVVLESSNEANDI